MVQWNFEVKWFEPPKLHFHRCLDACMKKWGEPSPTTRIFTIAFHFSQNFHMWNGTSPFHSPCFLQQRIHNTFPSSNMVLKIDTTKCYHITSPLTLPSLYFLIWHLLCLSSSTYASIKPKIKLDIWSTLDDKEFFFYPGRNINAKFLKIYINN